MVYCQAKGYICRYEKTAPLYTDSACHCNPSTPLKKEGFSSYVLQADPGVHLSVPDHRFTNSLQVFPLHPGKRYRKKTKMQTSG